MKSLQVCHLKLPFAGIHLTSTTQESILLVLTLVWHRESHMCINTCLQSGSFFLVTVYRLFVVTGSYLRMLFPLKSSQAVADLSLISLYLWAWWSNRHPAYSSLPFLHHCPTLLPKIPPSFKVSAVKICCLLPSRFWSFDLWGNPPHSLEIFGYWLTNTTLCLYFCHDSWSFK